VLADSTWPLLLFSPWLFYFAVRWVHYFTLQRLGTDAPRDREMWQRGHSILLGRSLRQAYAWSLAPLVAALARMRVKPNTLTAVCLCLSLIAGVCFALGAVALGGVIALVGASFDYFDGRIARMSGRVTRAGGFLDSVLDRYGEVAFFAGAAVLLRDSIWQLIACLLALGASSIISYARARAEACGVAAHGGLMQRPERIVTFCAGACLNAPLDRLLPAELQGRYLVFASAIALLAVLTVYTSIQRTVAAFNELRRSER
jgi:CDP-diacylglycerol---glycerol-3-phosphate 3-phosphatidyltransferase